MGWAMRSQINAVLASVMIALVASPCMAFEATITRVSSIEAHPAGNVSRIDLPPLEGVPVAPPRAPAAAYVAEPRVPSQIPIPTSNRAAVSWCLSEVL